MLEVMARRSIVVATIISLLIAIVLPTAAFADQGRGRKQDDRYERRYERRGRRDEKKFEKFINGHDARDGRWDRRGNGRWNQRGDNRWGQRENQRWDRRNRSSYRYNPSYYQNRNNYLNRNRYRYNNGYYLNRYQGSGYNNYDRGTAYDNGSGSILGNLLGSFLNFQ